MKLKESDTPGDALGAWRAGMAAKVNPTALLCGAKQWVNSVNLPHKDNAKNAKWMTTDIEGGDGVDVVMDLEVGYPQLEFDGIFCPSILEHVRRPWFAVSAMTEMLKPGGLLFISTHQTFPLHYYPQDYFRFSKEALIGMAWDANLVVLSAGYDSPCKIVPPPDVTVWNPQAESFLGVSICARRP